jgi:hypothetical protein
VQRCTYFRSFSISGVSHSHTETNQLNSLNIQQVFRIPRLDSFLFSDTNHKFCKTLNKIEDLHMKIDRYTKSNVS